MADGSRRFPEKDDFEVWVRHRGQAGPDSPTPHGALAAQSAQAAELLRLVGGRTRAQLHRGTGQWEAFYLPAGGSARSPALAV